MQLTRALLLIAILAIVGSVGAIYYARLKQQHNHAAEKPKPLPPGIAQAAQNWEYTETKDGKPVVYIRAKEYKETQGKFELTGLELHIFHKGAAEYDLVKSDKAEFQMGQSQLFSNGDVQITMGVPAEAAKQPSGRLMSIQASKVTFDTKTGKATTDQPATFSFDQDHGQCTGAVYDPQTHELHMTSHVDLVWRGRDQKAQPMHVEAGALRYAEKESKVYLSPWSKMQRGTLAMNGGPSVVSIADGLIRQVDSEHAQGTDDRPGRRVEYGADRLAMTFDDNGQVNRILGETNARLVSSSSTGRTTLTSDRVDLDFKANGDDSQLASALATGHSVAESVPVAADPKNAPEKRILRSDVIQSKMREGGEELESVETQSAGTLEFIPNPQRPDQPHRWMTGDRFWIAYGPRNQIESFRSINASTRTVKARPKDAKVDPPPALTWSKDLKAGFDPKTAQLTRLEQSNEFRYQEGTRQAKADRAVLDQTHNLIHLNGVARVWDPAGSTDADAIDLDGKTGDFAALGNVNSTRMPGKLAQEHAPAAELRPVSSGQRTDGQPPESGGLLSEDEPLHAKAKKMFATDDNTKIRYEGDAVAWQGGNRLQADAIEIDRDEGTVKAQGRVVSQLLDKKEDQKPVSKVAKGKNAKKDSHEGPVFTIVKAPELLYNDETRLADYKGGAYLERPDMVVKAQEIRAFLRDTKDDSSLDHVFADGHVEILSTRLNRRRTGTSEHAEYYVDQDEVVLTGGKPQFIDSKKGSTRGEKLTWFSKDDRLLVNGAESDPAQSKLRRR